MMETCALSLKTAIDSLFADHGLSLKKLGVKAMTGQVICKVSSMV